MRFRFYRLRFHFVARGQVVFPAGKAGNLLRGAFGANFRSVACAPDCLNAKTCEMRARCASARVFEPASTGSSPSGLADWPRPFVFRPSSLDGRSLQPGTLFHFDVHLFQLHDPAITYFVLAFARMAQEGLGPGRGRAELTAVDQLDSDGSRVRQLWDGKSFRATGEVVPTEVSLAAVNGPAERVCVRFLTPTELKYGQQVIRRPEFGVLLSRIRDRLSTLTDLYGDGPLQMDFAAFGRRAEAVRMLRCELREVEVARVSSRTGQRHSLGGFVGVAEYAGDLAEFIPFLKAARFTGVGRQTTWGKGEIAVKRTAM